MLCYTHTVSFNFRDNHTKTVIIILMFQIGKWMAWEIGWQGFSLGTWTWPAEHKVHAPSTTNTVSLQLKAKANIKFKQYKC